MKEVMAFVRLNMINQTKRALLDAGFTSITCRKVLGRGKKKVDFIPAEISPLEIAKNTPGLAETISEEHRLVPKRFLTLIVKDEEAQTAVEAIMTANKTGNPGDGKIFILPIKEVYRVRTGEKGESAV